MCSGPLHKSCQLSPWGQLSQVSIVALWASCYNVQRTVTPKVGNSELWFLCSAYHVMVIYICIKFQENFSVFKLHSRHIYYRNHCLQCSKGHNSKNGLSRVMVIEFCTFSHDDLHLYEVLSKYLKWFPTYRVDTSSW